MNKTLKTISVILAVLLITGVMSTANPVFAAEVNENYMVQQTFASMQSRSVTEENLSKLRIDDKYDYHKKDVGRAGTIYFNDYTSQVHIVREDMSLYCPNLPVELTSYYNSDETDYVNGLGYGWRTSYHQKLTYNSSDNSFSYYDGRSNYIVFEDNGEYDSTTREWVEMTDYCTEAQGYTLYTPLNDYTDLSQVTVESGNLVREFDSSGYLTKITRTLENSQSSSEETTFTATIDYLTTNNLHLINKITDSVNREYRFSYSYNSTYGKYVLSTIQAYNASGTAISMASSQPYKLSFTYNYITVNGATYPTLSTVTYPDGEVVNYTINSSTVLLKDIDGFAVEVTGLNATTQTIKEKAYTSASAFTTGTSLTVTKSNDYKKVFKDSNNVSKTKQFDYYGRTVCTVNNDGTIVPVIYKDEGELNGTQTEELYNLHYYDSYSSEANLVTNGSFSNGKTGWDGSAGTVVSEHSNSLKFSVNGSDVVYVSQVVNIADGKENDKYVIGFSTKQVNDSSNTEVYAGIEFFARKSVTGTESWEDIGFMEANPFITDWQSYAREFEINEEYNQIKIVLCYNQVGEAYFDDVKLYKSLEQPEMTLEELLESIEGLSLDVTNESYATGKLFKITGDTKELFTSSSFTNWTNQVVTDYNDNDTRYLYNTNTGLIARMVDGNAGNTTYTYNGVGELASVSQTVSGLGTLTTSYAYTDDKISSVTHNGFSYNYEYDVWGNITSVKVGTQPLVSYQYASNNTDVNKITYGNGDYVTYSYNSAGEVSTIKSYSSGGILKSHFAYTYSGGELSKVTDVLNGTETLYDGENFTLKNTNSNEVYYSTSEVGKNTIENYGNVSYNLDRESEDFDLITSATYNVEENSAVTKQYKFNSERDEFGRTTEKIARTFSAQEDGLNIDFYVSSEYDYKDVSDTRTTLLVDSYKTSVGLCAQVDGEFLTEPSEEMQYFYSYDSMGNIVRIYVKELDEDGSVLEEITLCSYTYDKAGQLTRENNALLQKTFVYAYDIGGNIVSKSEYDFTEEATLPSSANDTIAYVYDGTWKDKLTSFDGTAISYDSMGNPLNYVGVTVSGDMVEGSLTWNGRQLASVEVDGYRYEYSYDQNGLRTKSVKYDVTDNTIEETMKYVWVDGVLAGYSLEKPDTGSVQTVKILFDDTGDSIGYTYYNADDGDYRTFYFQKNIQGDIVSVYDDEGTLLVTYNYDAWGNVTPSAHGSGLEVALKALVALMFTPITYRGYNYDIYTGLYYLQTRYYNPSYGRFLNADTTEILERTKGTVLGANIFAYCNNNPVMNVDYTGEFVLTPLGVVKLFIIIIALLAVGVSLPLIMDFINNNPNDIDGQYEDIKNS